MASDQKNTAYVKMLGTCSIPRYTHHKMCAHHIHYTVTPSHDRYISRNNTLGSYTYYKVDLCTQHL